MRKTWVLLLLAFGSMGLACTNEGGLFGRGVKIGYPVSPACNHPYLLTFILNYKRRVYEERSYTPLRSEAWRIKSRVKVEEVASRVIDALKKLGYVPTDSKLVIDGYSIAMLNDQTSKVVVVVIFGTSDQWVHLVATWWKVS